MLAGQLVMAQTQLPNANFENWATADNNTDSTAGWSSSNAVVMYPVRSLYKETDAFQGDFSAKVVTAPFGFVQYTTIGMLVNGQAEFSYGGGGGGANVEYASGGGTPISIKPSELRGFYKYETNSAADQGMAKVLLSRYNTTTNKRDTVSYVSHTFPIQASYTPFTITLTDLMPGVMPDTITTIFSASNPATVPANSVFSSLYLDSITLYKPATPPVTDFQADVTTGITNTTVIIFDDLSTNTPTSWNWTFTPNTVAYQSGTSATSENPKVKFTAAGNYNVKLRVSNADGSDSLTKTAYIQISDGSTGISKTALLQDDALYPNPAKDKMFLKQDFLGADLRIADISGRILVARKSLKSTRIDLSSIPDGTYLISVTQKGQTRSGKLVIRK
jgi:PKD repeat protein